MNETARNAMMRPAVRMWSSSTLRFWAMNVHAIGAWRLLVQSHGHKMCDPITREFSNWWMSCYGFGNLYASSSWGLHMKFGV